MTEAVILAGGKGERLRPLTNDRPKTMIEINGKPLMAYQLHWLKSSGVQRVLVSCGYQHEVIQKYFGDGSKWDIQIEYFVEKEPLGRGGGLKLALKHLKDTKSPVLAINGDMVTTLNLDEVLRFYDKHKPMAALVSVPLKSPYGVIDINEADKITGFREKPELPYWINAGIYVLSPEIQNLLPDVGDHEEMTFPQLALEKKLVAYKSRYYWRTVDTVKDLSELLKELETMKVQVSHV